MRTVLITGCNRGIGLKLTQRYAELGWRVLACCRDPHHASALQALADQHSSIGIYPLDVSDEEQIVALARELDLTIDILLNNAGIYATGANEFGQVNKALWLKALTTNTIAPLLMAQAFVDHVAASDQKIIATVSSKVGSIADNHSGGGYAYRSSKAAVNQVMKSLSIDLAPQGIKVAGLHPGWVQTDMGGPNALIDTVTSADGMIAVLEGLTAEQSGGFFNYDGSCLPW